ncbi:hypothetical protein [Methanosarcina mazei]|nr:hypothetical protein [Methanosarcina mazei]
MKQEEKRHEVPSSPGRLAGKDNAILQKFADLRKEITRTGEPGLFYI